jgi:hypothetical protein
MNIQRLSRDHRRRIFGGYYAKLLQHGPIAYWPLWEAAGSSAECLVNPVQAAGMAGVTWGQTGIGDGKTSALFDGANDYGSVTAAPLSALAAAFNPAEGTVLTWAKVSGAGVWSDGGNRQLFYTKYDTTNQLMIRKSTSENELYFYTRMGGTVKAVQVSLSTVDWFCAAVTWSKTANQVKAFVNGVQQGSTQTGLGTWNPANLIACWFIGSANSSPANVWDGNLAHQAIFDRALAPAELLDLAGV